MQVEPGAEVEKEQLHQGNVYLFYIFLESYRNIALDKELTYDREILDLWGWERSQVEWCSIFTRK